jgi:hypothetical protein
MGPEGPNIWNKVENAESSGGAFLTLCSEIKFPIMILRHR